MRNERAKACAWLLVTLTCTGSARIPLDLDSFDGGLDGAGCRFQRVGQEQPVLLVDFKSIEEGMSGVARVRIAGVEHRLDWMDRSKARWLFRDGTITVTIVDMLEVDPVCRGEECEGSHYRARLTLERGSEKSSYGVQAHCGS